MIYNNKLCNKLLNKIKVFLPILLIIFLAGCLKTFKMTPESYQGKEYKEKEAIVEANLRSVKVYDEWETEAMFDILWLSNMTKRAIADVHCSKYGKSETEKREVVQKELAKNREKISFYILADIRSKFSSSLSDKNSQWSVFLELSDKRLIRPSADIKEVELDPEVLLFFEHRYSSPKFKTPYLVTFDAKDSSGDMYISSRPFKMIISSVERRCEVGWQGGNPVLVKHVGKRTKKKGRLRKDEDWYWL